MLQCLCLDTFFRNILIFLTTSNTFYCRSQKSYISSYKKELKSDAKELEKYLQLDNQIFEFAVVKFNQQKKAYSDDFENDLETF